MGEMWQWIMQLLSHGQGASMPTVPGIQPPAAHTKPLLAAPQPSPIGATSNDRMYTGGSSSFDERGGPGNTPNRGVGGPTLTGGNNPMNMLMRMMAR